MNYHGIKRLPNKPDLKIALETSNIIDNPNIEPTKQFTIEHYKKFAQF